MEKLTILGKDFAVTKKKMHCVNAAFFSVQGWSDTRIYSLSFSDSEALTMSFDQLASNTEQLANGTSMRGSNPAHVPIVDTNIRNAVLAKLGKTLADWETAKATTDNTFFETYDKLLLSLYLNKDFDVCKVSLNVATLTDGKFTTYKPMIDGNETTTATSRDVYDFENAIEKSALSAVADILQNLEEDDEEEE